MLTESGDSGSGKTVAIRKMVKERSRKGQKVLVFNYRGTHEEILADRENYNVIKVKEERVLIPFLECLLLFMWEAKRMRMCARRSLKHFRRLTVWGICGSILF